MATLYCEKTDAISNLELREIVYLKKDKMIFPCKISLSGKSLENFKCMTM